MPDTPAPSQGEGATPQAPDNRGFFEKYGGSILRMFVLWTVMKFITEGGFFGSQRQPINATVVPSASHADDPASTSNWTLPQVSPLPKGVFYHPSLQWPLSALPESFVPLWPIGTLMDMSVYINDNEYFVDYDAQPAWQTTGIMNGNVNQRTQHVDIPISSSVQQNGTLYAHIFLTHKALPIDPYDSAFSPNGVVYHRHTLTKFYPKKSLIKQKKLLDKSSSEQEETEELQDQVPNKETDTSDSIARGLLDNLSKRAPLVAYWQENVTITIVNDAKNSIPKSTLHPPIMKFISFDHALSRDSTGKVGFYKPILFPNDVWQLRQNAYPVNDTISVLPLTIHLEPISMWKFNIFAAFEDSMNQQANNPLGGVSASEMDELKRMLLDTNPVLLATTFFVSILHSVFEMLAFKNDIAFWKKKDNSTGVSVRSILVNIFFQVVIFLYLMDNNQETSWMILFGQGVGLLIEVWKVFKALKFEFVWAPGSFLPTLRSKPSVTTKEEDETAEYDAIAFKYLMWVSYPLLFSYAVYSLLYDEHKSWYSYVLKTLVEFVYMFGFITMLPQLYINYRLKSVAHMPWRTLMYKSLNTFIDDLFAFVIKMPTLHRLACLRDDVVFVIYLYQRHVYKVDPTRANEYGQVGEPSKATAATEDESKEEKESKKTK